MASNAVQSGKNHLQMNGGVKSAGAGGHVFENGVSIQNHLDERDPDVLTDGDIGSDPELKAEVQYAKEHGLDPNALPLRQKLRLLKRAKSMEEPPRQLNGLVQVPRSQKNQRRPRTGKGRGLAKKEGGGGKWTWGAVNRVYEDPEFLDHNDPNYDSDAASGRNVRYQAIKPELGEAAMEKYVEPIILEFFENDDLNEAVDSIDELSLAKSARPGVIRLAVTLSMDRKPSAREWTSQLISDLVAHKILTMADVERGFNFLLNVDLPDLVLDYPNAPEIVGNFMARAVADEALSMTFISENTTVENGEKETWKNSFAPRALEHGQAMAVNKHRLDSIWGVGGPTRPVRYLVNKVKQLLEEYLQSGDADEAARCLQELEVPHFHHELVYQAGIMTIEAMHQRSARQLASLLAILSAESVLSVDAIRMGFERLYEALPDLCLDVPPAYTLLERWIAACRQVDKPFLPDNVVRKMPQKGRKRFVSEGDGGRLKVVDVPHPYL